MKCKVRGGTFKPYEAHTCRARSVEMQAWAEKHKEQIKRQIRKWIKEKYNE